MKCLFCKAATTGKEPREHIIPESLGNHEHILKRGTVCGKCNNYFASKVEKPFLEHPTINSLRFHQCLPSKKGRIPLVKAIMKSSDSAPIAVELMRDKTDGTTSVCVPADGIEALMSASAGEIIVYAPQLPKPDIVVSRFVAKVGLEALVSRMDNQEKWLAELVSKPELDEIRSHARYGTTLNWPVSIRQIYDTSTS